MSRTSVKVTQRVNEIYAMLIAGLRREVILRTCIDKQGWPVRPRTIDGYIAMAKERFEEEAKIKREAELGKVLARLDDQYLKADMRKDHRGATMIVRERIELLGLRKPTRLEHSGSVQLTIPEAQRIVDDFLGKHPSD